MSDVPKSSGDTSHHRFKRATHFIFARRLCFGGLAGALVFFCFSLTPGLLPRGAVTQGVLCGIAAVIGYGIGSAISAGVRKLIRHEPSKKAKRIAWWILIALTLILVPLFISLGAMWQNDVRHLVQDGPLEAWSGPAIVLVAVVMAALLLILSRGVRGFARGIGRAVSQIVPKKYSVPMGVAIAVILVVGVLQGFLLTPLLDGLNSIYSVNNTGTSAGVTQPTSTYRSGSPQSLIPWSTLGIQGRDFTGSGSTVGPTASQLSAFNGKPAMEPIRVYVGLASAPTLDERVQLALRELDRTNAWSRKVIVVFTTTGTGWVDERAASPLEYMYNGNTAEIGLQYSYLPSWVSFLVDDQKAADSGTAMIHAVAARIHAMPKDARPKLYVFGESLGSYGTESAFKSPAEMVAGVDGALFEGPVFKNPIHNVLTEQREPSSPSWRPVYHTGRNFRFAVAPSDVSQPATPWVSPRIVYLQNSTDPITYFDLNLLWSRPDWLNNPRGPDVSSDVTWMPVVTFWQIAADMMFSTKVPLGHGHNYGINAVNAWAAVSQPQGWSSEKSQHLRQVLSSPKV